MSSSKRPRNSNVSIGEDVKFYQLLAGPVIKRMGPSFMKVVAGIWKGTIKCIDLENVQLTTEQVHALSGAIMHRNDATDLNLKGCGLNDEHMSILCGMFAINRSIIEFNASRNAISDIGCANFKSSLKTNPRSKLNALDLSKNNITDVGLVQLVEGISVLSEFSSLTINENEGITFSSSDLILRCGKIPYVFELGIPQTSSSSSSSILL